MTTNDREWKFLAEQTGRLGTFNDLYYFYLRDLGYNGTLSDMIAASGLGLTPSRVVVSPATILGDDLLAWWTADDISTMTLVDNAVSAWRDKKNGYELVQATNANRPTYDGTAFNGNPCLSFDGTNDQMSMASVPFPTGNSGREVWLITDQVQDATNTTEMVAFAYGGGSAANAIRIGRSVSTTVRGMHRVGDGSTNGAVITTTPEFIGRHLLRATAGPSGIGISIDGGTLITQGSPIPNTGTTRTRVGATDAGTPANYWRGLIRDVIVTSPLDNEQVTALTEWALDKL